MMRSKAIEYLTWLQKNAEVHDGSPLDALRSLEHFLKAEPRFSDEVRDGTHSSGVAWLKAWGRHPATYSYRSGGGYAAFCEYKYHLRRGEKSLGIPEKMQLIVRQTFADMPISPLGEHQHNVPSALKQEAEYDG